MSIGDVNSQEKGSGARYNSGKVDFSYIDLAELEDELRVWAVGEKKYAKDNWRKGMPWSAPFASMMRHMSAWQQGEDLDPETGLPHLAHAMCNLRMLALYKSVYPEGDDRRKRNDIKDGKETQDATRFEKTYTVTPASVKW